MAISVKRYRNPEIRDVVHDAFDGRLAEDGALLLEVLPDESEPSYPLCARRRVGGCKL